MLYEVYYSCTLDGTDTTGRIYYPSDNENLSSAEIEEILNSRYKMALAGWIYKIKNCKVLQLKKH